MLDRILPARVDNRYRGHPIGLWLFVPIALIRLSQSLTHLLRHDGGAQSITTIPLDTYAAGPAQNVIGLFARLGLEQLMLASIFLLVLIRYRALVPLMYFMMVAHYIGGRIVGQFKPLALAGISGVSTPFLVIAILSAIGLILSVIGRGYEDEVARS